MKRLLNQEALLQKTESLYQSPISLPSAISHRSGSLIEIGPTVLKAYLPWAIQGEICHIGEPGTSPAEVISIVKEVAYLSPFDPTTGLRCGLPVFSTGEAYTIGLGPQLQGMVVDGLGRPLMDAPFKAQAHRPLVGGAPDPMRRTLISQPLSLGVRAIDGLITCGQGQRIGIFAAAGGGKSTLLGMIAGGTSADVVVLALVGERGREVKEFLETTLTSQARAKSVVVVATSDRSALERLKATFTATTIAEYFRDQGLQVLLMVDSLTRYARAAREIGLASGEPPVARGFPPSVFAMLPCLLERAGTAPKGAITGIYTVLVEGDDMNEPVADEVRSILDGHIVLSRALAEKGHYPAIDVNASISRVMSQIASSNQLKWANRLRRLISVYQSLELLIRVGEYKAGADPEADEAIKRWPLINRYLEQSTQEHYDLTMAVQQLQETVEG